MHIVHGIQILNMCSVEFAHAQVSQHKICEMRSQGAKSLACRVSSCVRGQISVVFKSKRLYLLLFLVCLFEDVAGSGVPVDGLGHSDLRVLKPADVGLRNGQSPTIKVS